MAFDHTHSQDSECTVNPATDCCYDCGTHHGTPCEDCGGRGFHLPTCPEMLALGPLDPPHGVPWQPEPTVHDMSWFYRWLDRHAPKNGDRA